MLTIIFFILVCIFNSVTFGRVINLPAKYTNICQPDCDSKIYCQGQFKNRTFTLLHDVQTSGLYKDGTEFVRKKMKNSETVILQNYWAKKQAISNDDRQNNTTWLQNFINEHFENESLVNVNLTDFNPNAKILQDADSYFRNWLTDLNKLWNTLARRLSESTKKDIEKKLSSYIYVPNDFVVAGGRFNEMYYWDSYWIIKGLLACGMTNTTRGIIENIIHLVNQYGYMPNGNRIYYSQRSQPPMLILMAKLYLDATNDAAFIKKNLKTFEKEFKWWYDHRLVRFTSNSTHKTIYHLFRYHSVSCFPRPESYKEDYNLLKNYEPEDIDEEIKIYTGIRSAAESGWDFSSRHMRDPEYSKNGDEGLRNMNPGEYAYVELNSIMYSNVKLLAEWKRKFGNKIESNYNKNLKFYDNFAKKMFDSIENVLWNKEEGIWLDFDLMNKTHRNFFFATNLAPLWSEAYNKTKTAEIVDKAINYLERNNITDTHLKLKPHLFGIPTTSKSMNDSHQQWDYPNIWAPLQSFVIGGLKKTNIKRAQIVAFNLASAFVNTTFAAYYHNKKNPSKHEMYEKYNGVVFGQEGQKGEYECATGFGWTNGFIFELFTMWNCFPISPELANSANDEVPKKISFPE